MRRCCLERFLFLPTGEGYLRCYPGIENLILPMLSYPGRQVTSLCEGYILLPLLCSILLISPNFAVKSIIVPNFGQGPFPKFA